MSKLNLKLFFFGVLGLFSFLSSCEVEEIENNQLNSEQKEEFNLVTKYLGADKFQVKPEENGFYSLGDMYFNDEVLSDNPVDLSQNPMTSALSIKGVSKWPNNTVSYVWGNISNNGKNKYQQAMKAISDATNLTFKLRSGETNYVTLSEEGSGGGGYASVGAMSNSFSKIGTSAPTYVAIHELLHVLGIMHEQMRNDRDNYVTILWQNIDPKNQYNFQKETNYDHLGTSYDINSIMHYGSYGFSINGQPTILQKNGAELPRNEQLTSTDIAGIDKLYPGNGGGGTTGETKAVMKNPAPGSTLNGSSATFSWDRPNGGTHFDLIIGTNGAGSNNIRSSSVFTSTSISVNNLPTNGQTIYVRLWTWNGSSWDFNDYTYTAGGGGTTDICSGVSPWRSGVNYKTGDRVTYYGYLYELTNSGWQVIGQCG